MSEPDYVFGEQPLVTSEPTRLPAADVTRDWRGLKAEYHAYAAQADACGLPHPWNAPASVPDASPSVQAAERRVLLAAFQFAHTGNTRRELGVAVDAWEAAVRQAAGPLASPADLFADEEAGPEEDGPARCTCTWENHDLGAIGIYPAEVDCACAVHGESNGFQPGVQYERLLTAGPTVREWLADLSGDARTDPERRAARVLMDAYALHPTPDPLTAHG